MSRSWGHAIFRLSEAGRAKLAEEARTYWQNHGNVRSGYECSIGRVTHMAPAAFVTTYQYVTGRAGRVSYARKLVCEEHGQAFAKKHGLDLEEAPVVEDQYGSLAHASERAFAQIRGDAE